MSSGIKSITLSAQGYPAISWVTRHAAALPPLVAIMLLGGSGLSALRDLSAWWLAGAAVCACTAMISSRLLIEIKNLLVETLIGQ